MIGPQVNQSQWLNLPTEIRVKLATIFNLSRSTGSHVMNNTVQCDGHTDGDLLGISVEKMQQLLGSSETDFYKLFNAVVEYVKGDVPVAAVSRETAAQLGSAEERWGSLIAACVKEAHESGNMDALHKILSDALKTTAERHVLPASGPTDKQETAHGKVTPKTSRHGAKRGRLAKA